MAKTKEQYNTTPVVLDPDFEPPAPVGVKTTYWNTQVEELTANPGKLRDDFAADKDKNPSLVADPKTDVKGGWRFYPAGQSKGHDLPKKYPGIERRVGEHNGVKGLFMRFNPVLKDQIEAANKAGNNSDKGSDKGSPEKGKP